MIRFEFFNRLEEWYGIHHFRAWRDRMSEVAEGFVVKEGVLVFYSFLAPDSQSAEMTKTFVFAETKEAVHQKGPRRIR